MNKNLAIIDLGTNTFHLLVARQTDDRITIIHRERLAVKIGMGGINQKTILPEAIDRAVLAMQSFKNTMEKMEVQEVYAFGTSALRNANNAQAVLDEIKSITGINVEVISGDKEADFIYRGATSALDLGLEKSLILDIGGGSVEFIIGNNKEIFWKESVDIGAQRLLEEFQQHDPIQPDELNRLENYFKTKLSSLFTALQEHNPKNLSRLFWNL